MDDLGVESDKILSTGTLARLKLTATCLPYTGDDKYLTQREGCWQGSPLSKRTQDRSVTPVTVPLSET